MAGSGEILQQFLVEVGYTTDVISLKKFEDGLGKTGKAVFGVGTKVAGVVAAIDTAAAAFAYSMRKMYFQSELSKSSVKNLEGMEFAGKQAGISADSMAGAIQQLAMQIRLNPGIQQMIESFGVRVTGRDMSDVAMDTVKALSKMPENVATQWGQLLGIDPKTFLLMKEHQGEISKARKEMAGVYKEMGFDPDDPKNKKAIKDLTHDLDLIGEKFKILGQAILVNFVVPLEKSTKALSDLLSYWANVTTGKKPMIEGGPVKAKEVWGFTKEILGVGEEHHELIDLFKGNTPSDKEKEDAMTSMNIKNSIIGASYATLGAGPLGGNPVTLIQKTDINVTGTDARSTANAVAGHQSRVNDQMLKQATRDLKGVSQ